MHNLEHAAQTKASAAVIDLHALRPKCPGELPPWPLDKRSPDEHLTRDDALEIGNTYDLIYGNTDRRWLIASALAAILVFAIVVGGSAWIGGHL